MAMARAVWGVDIGDRALKVIKLARTGQAPAVQELAVFDHQVPLSQAGDRRDEILKATLEKFASQYKLRGQRAAVGVSGQMTFSRFTALPPVDAKKLPDIVKFEAVQRIPFPLDEVEWSYQLFGGTKASDVEAGIFAIRKTLVAQQVAYLTDLGMSVELVQLNPLAVVNAMQLEGRPAEVTAYVDMGSQNTDLIISNPATGSLWIRSIQTGGNAFTEAIQDAFKLPREKSEELKRTVTRGHHEKQILTVLQGVFNDFVGEISKSIGFYGGEHREAKIRKCVVMGGGMKMARLAAFLQQNLQIPVEVVSKLPVSAPAEGEQRRQYQEHVASMATATGLAVQALGMGEITCSLLPAGIRRVQMWQAKGKWFAAAAALFVAGSMLAGARYVMDSMAYEDEANAKVRKEMKVTLDKANELSSRWDGIEGRVGIAEARDIVNRLNSATWYRRVWRSVLNDLNTAMPHSVDMKVPREERRHVVAERIDTHDYPDLTAVVDDLDQGRIKEYLKPGSAQSSNQDIDGPPGPGGRPARSMARGDRPGYLIQVWGYTTHKDASATLDGVCKVIAKKKVKDRPYRYTEALLGATQKRASMNKESWPVTLDTGVDRAAVMDEGPPPSDRPDTLMVDPLTGEPNSTDSLFVMLVLVELEKEKGN